MYFTGWISRQCPKSVFSTRGLSPLWSKSANRWWDHFRLASSHLPFSPKSRPAFASSMASHRLKKSIFMELNVEKLHKALWIYANVFILINVSPIGYAIRAIPELSPSYPRVSHPSTRDPEIFQQANTTLDETKLEFVFYRKGFIKKPNFLPISFSVFFWKDNSESSILCFFYLILTRDTKKGFR